MYVIWNEIIHCIFHTKSINFCLVFLILFFLGYDYYSLTYHYPFQIFLNPINLSIVLPPKIKTYQ